MSTISHSLSDGVSVDTALSNRGVNPSIGEVSLGMSASLSMGSGSHLDRVGIVDRENSSTIACAGSIASGKSGNVSHKLEIQADVSSNKRFSLSSRSDTLSFGDRSGNVSLFDDQASTRALAGSILGYREATIGGNTNPVTPVEVHADGSLGYANAGGNALLTESLQLEQVRCPHAQMSNNGCTECCVSYIDESPSPCETLTEQTPVSSKAISFQLPSASRIKYESRSLEQLPNYCEICQKVHRPCCPNYYQKLPIQNGAAKKTSNSRGSSDEDQQQAAAGRKSCKGYRKASIKSTKSETQTSATKSQSQSDLKRVRSSDSGAHRAKSSKQKWFSKSVKSTPTSPTSSESIAFDKERRAYFRVHTKASQEAKISHITIDIDDACNATPQDV